MTIIKRPSISCGTICLNEEKFITPFLNNVVDKVDEIVIVEGGSTDSTIEQIQQFNSDKIKLYHFKQGKSYSDDWRENEHRNYMLNCCCMDYILLLDVDHMVEDDFLSKFFDIIKRHPLKLYFDIQEIHYFGGLDYVRVNSGSDNKWTPQKRLGLVKNYKGLEYSNRPNHCQIIKKRIRRPLLTDIVFHHLHYAFITDWGIKERDNRSGDFMFLHKKTDEIRVDPTLQLLKNDNYQIKKGRRIELMPAKEMIPDLQYPRALKSLIKRNGRSGKASMEWIELVKDSNQYK